MSKYGCGLSSNEVCKLELEEMETILDKYNVSEEDKDNLMDMLEEAYFQLSNAYTSARVLEKHLEKGFSFKTYIHDMQEEAQKFPFESRKGKEEIE